MAKAEESEKQTNLTSCLYFLTRKSNKWPTGREVLVDSKSEGPDVVHTVSTRFYLYIREIIVDSVYISSWAWWHSGGPSYQGGCGGRIA